ncbi:MAG TPA: T9SS type A sorting domain-containing protein, partial [Flavisolibacter sp.]|nr:T9SS type A sorting domain-containing protein [Flavisolibacter sp.]
SGAVEYSNTVVMATTTSNIAVYPNPAQESFTVEVNNKVAAHYTVALYTMDGQLVFRSPLFANKKATVIYPRPAGLKSGTYILRITNLSANSYDNRKLLFQ